MVDVALACGRYVFEFSYATFNKLVQIHNPMGIHGVYHTPTYL